MSASWTMKCPNASCSTHPTMSRITNIIWCNKCGKANIFGGAFRCPSCCFEFCSKCRTAYEKEEAAKKQREHEAKMEKNRLEREKQEQDHVLAVKELDMKEKEADAKRKAAAAEKAAQRKKAEDKRQQEQMKLQADLAKQKLEKEEEVRKQEADHKQKLKEMNIQQSTGQRDKSVKSIQAAIKIWETQKDEEEKYLAKTKEELSRISAKMDMESEKITKFDKKGKLKEEQKTMALYEKQYLTSDDEISKTIAKTGVTQDSIGRFLKLTHRLIGDTVSTQEEANKLNAELATFGTMITRECQDRLSIQYYFKERNLDRFIPILAKENYTDLADLECKDDDEFDEIVEVIEEDIEKKLSEWNKRHGGDDDGNVDDAENLELLLKKYGLKKYIAAIKKAGMTGLTDCDDIDDETLDDIISEAKMNKMWAKKLKKAIKEYNKGKWEPPEKKEDEASKKVVKVETDETDEKDEKADEKDDPEPKSIKKGEKRQLKAISLNPDSWQTYEKEKADLTKKAMVEICPLLADFFSKMHTGVKQAQLLLSINDKLNKEQQQAVTMLMQKTESNKPKAVKAPTTDENSGPKIEEVVDDDNKKDDETKEDNTAQPDVNEVDDDDAKKDDNETLDDDEKKDDNEKKDDDEKKDEKFELPDYKERKGWKKQSKCEVKGKDSNWHDGTIMEVTRVDKAEWLKVEYEIDNKKTTMVQVGRYNSNEVRDKLYEGIVATMAVQQAAITCVLIKDTMSKEFNESAIRKRALATATGVEESCKQIIRCQAQIRQSVKLSGDILKLKPGNLTQEAAPLWDAVDKGVVRILESALEMTKITSQYFGFFLRFNQSFNRFVSMYDQNKDVSLLVSLEHVKQDINDFTKFKESFNKKVEELSEQAMDVITNCVKTHIGADQWKQARESREKSLALYLDAKEKYDTKELQLEDKLTQLQTKRADSRAKGVKLAYEQQRITDSITRTQQYIKDYRATEAKLVSMVFDGK